VARLRMRYVSGGLPLLNPMAEFTDSAARLAWRWPCTMPWCSTHRTGILPSCSVPCAEGSSPAGCGAGALIDDGRRLSAAQVVIVPKQKKLDPNRHRSRRYMTVLPLSPGRKVELEPLDAIKVQTHANALNTLNLSHTRMKFSNS
jgi:hypothetical protein